MKVRTDVLLWMLAGAVLWAILVPLRPKHPSSPSTATPLTGNPDRSAPTRISGPVTPHRSEPAGTDSRPFRPTPLPPSPAARGANLASPQQTGNSQQAANNGKAPPQDPVARVALGLVGVDSEAEMYWYEAINDPTLPAEERQDLIEDLNEDGFPDPDHPTVGDLPLIVSRLEILSEMGPDAMDKVNADAQNEAAKDLLNMYDEVVGR